jgi:hypothetical protein
MSVVLLAFTEIATSRLETGSSPIGVGIAAPRGVRESILIRRRRAWLTGASLWNRAVEQAHGLARESIADTSRPRSRTAGSPDALLKGKSVAADARAQGTGEAWLGRARRAVTSQYCRLFTEASHAEWI